MRPTISTAIVCPTNVASLLASFLDTESGHICHCGRAHDELDIKAHPIQGEMRPGMKGTYADHVLSMGYANPAGLLPRASSITAK